MPGSNAPRPYRKGAECWFIDERSRWFRCKIVDKVEGVLLLESVTGRDHKGEVEWVYKGQLPIRPGTQAGRRLRPWYAEPV